MPGNVCPRCGPLASSSVTAQRRGPTRLTTRSTRLTPMQRHPTASTEPTVPRTDQATAVPAAEDQVDQEAVVLVAVAQDQAAADQAVAAAVVLALETAVCLPVKAAAVYPDNVYNLWLNLPRGNLPSASQQPCAAGKSLRVISTTSPRPVSAKAPIIQWCQSRRWGQPPPEQCRRPSFQQS